EAACPPPAGGLSRLWALLATLLAPALILLLRRRLARGKERRDRLRERMGLTGRPRPAGRLIWLHAASVGESLSILPMIDRMMARDAGLHVLLTTATVNAADLLDRRLVGEAWGGRVIHQFVPLDVPRWIGRFLRHWRPDAAALTESELWPNLIEACHRTGVPLALINARLSDRSRDGWRRVPGLARRMLSRFGWIAARSAEDAARLRALGATRMDVPGDLKEAAAPLPADPAQLAGIVDAISGRPVWLAASTHDGEEELIAQADQVIRARHPDLLTVIVPRHPERGAAIAAGLETPPVPRRALGATPGPTDRFWVCDTLGELGLFYRAVPIVFIGNSLPGPGRGGGHNPMEPARLGAALASGPLTDNFTEAFARLGDTIAIVADPAALAEWVDGLLSDPARLAQSRRRAGPVEGDPDLPDRIAARLLAMAGG
ncbi:3-deoxy-D-manno-octulosonic acid transferase, partial [Gluconacetobacter azotocaptans]|uniref:3-deoxy-D-manno-octulosonic acid transferase n=1 Tax=Gluconacetobacter azotocaptans TaxID=142834 RepID=UPI001F049B98